MILTAIKGLSYARYLWNRWVLAGLLVLVTVLYAWSWTHQGERVEMVKVQVPEYITRIERVEVPGPERIVVREKVKVVHEAALPPEIADDPDKQVAEVAECAPNDGSTTVASVIDTRTGETTMYVRPERPAFFSTRPLTTKHALGLDIGKDEVFYTHIGGHYRYTWFRAGRFHSSFELSVNTNIDTHEWSGMINYQPEIRW